MSVARLGAPARAATGPPAAGPRPLGTGWLSFGLFAGYGTLRWSTLLGGGSGLGRLLICLALAVVLAFALRRLPLGRAGRAAGVGVAALGLIGVLGESGVPLAWWAGGHLGRVAALIGHGLSGLPGLDVPYRSAGPVRTVLLLGGGLCPLVAAVAFGMAGSPDRRTDRAEAPGPGLRTGRLAVAAVALTVLAVVPSAIVAPQLVYLHAMASTALAAALVFGPRLDPGRRAGGLMLVALAVTGGATAVGLSGGARVWFALGRVSQGAGSGGVTTVEGFDWTQTYGAQVWPRRGRLVLEVSAARPALWKAEDLDRFAAGRWQLAPSRLGDRFGVSAVNLRRYTETLGVSIEHLASAPVIAAGSAGKPGLVGVVPGRDPGTWTASIPLTPGDGYVLDAYVPDPSRASLDAARGPTPRRLAPFTALGTLGPAYAPVRHLAAALARRAGFGRAARVRAVLAYLAGHETYTLAPPAGGPAPLVSFLDRSHQGYCQQFAGAAALLLRLEGIPARVAVGFATGVRRPHSMIYLVRDRDAHAWIEVWFPALGWVDFDPTPGQPLPAGTPGLGDPRTANLAGRRLIGQTAPRLATRTGRARHRHAGRARGQAGSETVTTVLGAAGLGVGLLCLGALGLIRRRRRSAPVSVAIAELERLAGRRGRPLAPELTLHRLAEAFADEPVIADHLRALEADRFGPPAARPSGRRTRLARRARRALRRRLAALD